MITRSLDPLAWSVRPKARAAHSVTAPGQCEVRFAQDRIEKGLGFRV